VVVGVQVVGKDASSLVGEASLAVSSGISGAALGRIVHPHPTLTELFMEAGEAFGPGAIHG
jgi:dihydrolipoamide dehydrogenase